MESNIPLTFLIFFLFFCRVFSIQHQILPKTKQLNRKLLKQFSGSPMQCLHRCHLNKDCEEIGMKDDNQMCLLLGERTQKNIEIPCDENINLYKRVEPGVGSLTSPGSSCEQIKNDYPHSMDGTYYIVLNKLTEVYCDMSVSGGGWLMIGNVSIQSDTDLSNVGYNNGSLSHNIDDLFKVTQGNYLLSTNGMKDLYNNIKFKQVRVRCQKNAKVLHFATTLTEKGRKVIDFLLMITNTCPNSCGAMERLTDDNSYLMEHCDQMGALHKGLISGCSDSLIILNNQVRLYNHFIYISGKVHLLLGHFGYWGPRYECDDFIYDADYKPEGSWTFYIK